MPYRRIRLEVKYPGPEVVTSPSPAPAIIVTAWIVMVERMDRLTLDRFTQRIWRKFDAKDLDPLRNAIIRRRRTLACAAWPLLETRPAMVGHYGPSASAKRTDARVPTPAAIRVMFRSEIFFSPRSTAPMYVRCMPTRSASCS